MQRSFHHQNPSLLPSSPSRDERNNFISSMLYQVIFAYLIPVLVGILSANFQGTTDSLLKTHPISMWSFLVAQAIYCFALAADIKSLIQQQNSSQPSGIIAITSGSVSAVSLVSTFLPSSIGGIILYFSWACAVIIVVYQYGRLFMDACRQLLEHDSVTNIWNWFQANNIISCRQLLENYSVTNIWNWFQANNIIFSTEQQGEEEQV